MCSNQILAPAPHELEEAKAGSLLLPPKCPHAQVPRDNSMCSPEGSAAMNGGNCRFRGLLLTNPNQTDFKTCFPSHPLPSVCRLFFPLK